MHKIWVLPHTHKQKVFLFDAAQALNCHVQLFSAILSINSLLFEQQKLKHPTDHLSCMKHPTQSVPSFSAVSVSLYVLLIQSFANQN